MDMKPEVRLKKLVRLEERIREALLGEDPEARYDLVELQKKVRDEIKVMVAQLKELKQNTVS